MESDKREGKYVDPRAGLVTFERVAKDWLSSQTVDYTSRERFATRVKVHLLPFSEASRLARSGRARSKPGYADFRTTSAVEDRRASSGQ
jgi:hypothetical protein